MYRLNHVILYSQATKIFVLYFNDKHSNYHYFELFQRTLLPEGEKRLPGQLYYEALCFKAVNQSIGRAIRHSKDYAVLVLADLRYARSSSQSSLPGWIARQLKVTESFGPSIASVSKVCSFDSSFCIWI